MERNIEVNGTEIIGNVFGSFDENIKLIENELDVAVVNRDGKIKVCGGEENTESAEKVIKLLISVAERGETVTAQIGQRRGACGLFLRLRLHNRKRQTHTRKNARTKTVSRSDREQHGNARRGTCGNGKNISCGSHGCHGAAQQTGQQNNSDASRRGSGRKSRISAGRPAKQSRPVSAPAL